MRKLRICFLLIIPLFLLCSFTTNASSKEIKPQTDTTEENWSYILNNVDIDIKYLEPNKYLGLYWDSFVGGSSKDGYLYLCWTSPYYTKTNNTILQITESGKKYNLYNTLTDMQSLNGN